MMFITMLNMKSMIAHRPKALWTRITKIVAHFYLFYFLATNQPSTTHLSWPSFHPLLPVVIRLPFQTSVYTFWRKDANISISWHTIFLSALLYFFYKNTLIEINKKHIFLWLIPTALAYVNVIYFLSWKL